MAIELDNDAPAPPPAGPEAHNAQSAQEGLFHRFLYLLILSSCFGAILCYPFKLSEEVMLKFDAWARTVKGATTYDLRGGNLGRLWAVWNSDGGFTEWFVLGQLRAPLTFLYSPLVYKESVAAGFLLAVLGLLAFFLFRRQKTVGTGHTNGQKWFLRPFPWAGILFIYLVASASLSPTPIYSCRTLTIMVLAFGAFAGIQVSRCGLHGARKFMVGICLCGLVVAAISLLQHYNWGVKHFMVDWDDPRNRIGSLIGHNTGLSAWLLFPMSFCLCFAATSRRWPLRMISAGVAALIAFVIVAAQSRAIWIIAAILVPCILIAMARQVKVRFRLHHYLVVFLVALTIIAIQASKPRKAQVGENEVPLATRLSEGFSTRQLLAETRLRILLCSLPLVAKNPLFGYGIGTFQYVYPPAQGEYFQRNPDTFLIPTQKRTDLAHNDYLQMVVETGLAGCLLLLIPAILWFRQGLAKFRKEDSGQNRALMIALLAPALAVAAQAVVDFPFHIAPVGLTGLLSFAFWVQGGGKSAEIEHQNSPPLEQVRGAGFHPIRVILLAGAGICLLGCLAGYPFLLRDYISDIYYTEGTSWLTTQRAASQEPTPVQQDYAQRAKQQFRRAVVVNPFNGPAYEGLGAAFGVSGYLNFQDWRKAVANGETTRAEILKKLAVGDFESSVVWINNQRAQGEYTYHATFEGLGNAYLFLWRLKGVPEYLNSARTLYRKAVEMNIGAFYSLYQLADALDSEPAPDHAAANRYRQIIFKYDPGFAQAQYLNPILEKAARGNFAEADSQLTRFEQIAGLSWRVKLARAELYLRAALWPPPGLDKETTSPEKTQWTTSRLDLGEKKLAEIEGMDASKLNAYDQMDLSRIHAYYAAARQNWAETARAADFFFTRDPGNQEMAVLRSIAWQRADGRKINYPDSPEYKRQEALLQFNFLNKKQQAAKGLAGLTTSGSVVRLPDCLRVGSWLVSNRISESLIPLNEYMWRVFPGDPDAARLLQRTRLELAPEDRQTTTP
ncbi:MAG: O-antigen ligase family protein [Candidatus Sumerlaeaceae bacterium]|nr:O-antigen ligase family protein [Candidatus Sumerlaeaceae bacterium]